MSEAWQSYPRAPSRGAVICAVSDVPDPGTLSVEVSGFSVLLVRVDGKLRVYVNACPHQYLPLDYRRDQVLSADHAVLRCSNHQAGFSVDTGEGVDGFGQGCNLDAIPVSIRPDGMIVIS